MQYINPNAAALTPYAPGKPIDALARELGVTDAIKLASNENPHGPGPAVQEAIAAAAKELARYPDGNGFALKERLAAYHNVTPAALTLGNGSNDVLDLVARAVLEPGLEAIVAEHAFVVYRLATVTAGGRLVQVPAKAYGMDLGAALDAVTERTRLVFLANPNNPTGTWVGRDELQAFLDALPEHVWMVLDEAYFDYVSDPAYPDGMAWLERYPRLMVTRTFSKIHALAALRIGYAVSSPELADLMNRVRQPFNVNALGLAAAGAALDDTAFVDASRRANDAGLAQLTGGLTQLGLSFVPSVGNFVSFEVNDARGVYDRLLRSGVIVRPIAEYGLPNFLRVSVGLPEENERFLHSLQQAL